MFDMFKKVNVIGVNRKNMVFAKVDPKGDGRIVRSYTKEYDFATIREILITLVAKLKLKKVRLLFSDDLSYILNLKVPKDLAGHEEKKFIYGRIKEQIPENMSGYSWDYKELKKAPVSKYVKATEIPDKEVIVFAPVKNIYERIKEIITKEGVYIEAVEPEFLAKKRSGNPLIGIAKKKDLVGSDETVLNITSGMKDEFITLSPKNDRFSSKIIFLTLLIITVVLVVTVIGYIKLGGL